MESRRVGRNHGSLYAKYNSSDESNTKQIYTIWRGKNWIIDNI